jgi:CRP-like cAMP-binding protein
MSSHPCSPNADNANQLLASWPAEIWRHVQPDLDAVYMSAGQTLQEAGAPLHHVVFPTTAVVSLVSPMRDGGSSEVAVVGHEGMVGVCACMGGAGALSGAVVQTAGHGWRMRAPALTRHAARHPTVLLPLLRYAQTLFVQLAQTSACHRRHALTEQLCRWLLLHQDRLSGDELQVTHERLADLLGVWRETITTAALKLQHFGLIRYTRGRITLLDRAGLEAHSCECYAVVRSACDDLRDELRHLPAAAPAAHI